MSSPRTVLIVTPGLADQGGIASVVASYLESPLSSRWELRVVETVRGRGVWRHLRGVAGVAKACALVATNRECLVHVHMSFGGSFWRKACVVAMARAVRRPCVLHLHGSKFHTWAATGSGIRAGAVRRVFGMPDKVVVLSESWRQRVEEFSGRDDGIVVPNPVSIPPAVSEGRDKQAILFLGRLGERKGIYDLLEAIGDLQRAGSDASWVLAGDGDVAGVQQLVDGLPRPDLVRVPGWLDRSGVQAALSEAAVFCLPSYDEGVPIALLEAMAYGLACVVTPVGGMPEVVRDEENGLLTPAGNADVLAERLNRVLSDAVLRRDLGDRARETVISGYALDRVAEAVELLYESLSCPRARGGE